MKSLFASRCITVMLSIGITAMPSLCVADGDVALESVVVTGSRISYRDLLDTPAVAITRPGDYLLLPITLINDTRDERARKDEVHATIRKMVASAGQRFDVVQGETFTARIDGSREIPLQKDGKRPDVSVVSLFVRAAIDARPERADELTAALRDFVAKSERVGRTEIDVAAESALSLTRPERYRHEIIEAIAEDTAKVRAELGIGCKVLISGLSSRIEWERVSASELMLYIPYSMDISECGNAP